MIAYLQIGFFMLAAIAAVAVAANRFHAPSSIFLVLAGAALALVPDLPRVELMPELVLMLVLPPLIYSAGVAMSWRASRSWRSAVSYSPRLRSPPACIGCWAGRGRSGSCSAPSSRRRTSSHRSRLRGASGCLVGFGSSSKAKVLQTMPPR